MRRLVVQARRNYSSSFLPSFLLPSIHPSIPSFLPSFLPPFLPSILLSFFLSSPSPPPFPIFYVSLFAVFETAEERTDQGPAHQEGEHGDHYGFVEAARTCMPCTNYLFICVSFWFGFLSSCSVVTALLPEIALRLKLT